MNFMDSMIFAGIMTLLSEYAEDRQNERERKAVIFNEDADSSYEDVEFPSTDNTNALHRISQLTQRLITDANQACNVDADLSGLDMASLIICGTMASSIDRSNISNGKKVEIYDFATNYALIKTDFIGTAVFGPDGRDLLDGIKQLFDNYVALIVVMAVKSGNPKAMSDILTMMAEFMTDMEKAIFLKFDGFVFAKRPQVFLLEKAVSYTEQQMREMEAANPSLKEGPEISGEKQEKTHPQNDGSDSAEKDTDSSSAKSGQKFGKRKKLTKKRKALIIFCVIVAGILAIAISVYAHKQYLVGQMGQHYIAEAKDILASYGITDATVTMVYSEKESFNNHTVYNLNVDSPSIQSKTDKTIYEIVTDIGGMASYDPDMNVWITKYVYSNGNKYALRTAHPDVLLENGSEIYDASGSSTESSSSSESTTPSVPYVGMPESKINSTSLGRASSEVRHNNEMIGGQVYVANLYDFKRNGVTIFTARCVQGKVIQVWDDRDRVTSSSSGTSSGSSSKSKSTSSEADTPSDPYNVYDYDDPDDFYYDNYDDFDGYEDAEDYWYDHQK